MEIPGFREQSFGLAGVFPALQVVLGKGRNSRDTDIHRSGTGDLRFLYFLMHHSEILSFGWQTGEKIIFVR